MDFHHVMRSLAASSIRTSVVLCHACASPEDAPPSPEDAPPPPSPENNPSNKHLSFQMIIIVVVLATTFLLVSYAFLIRWFSARWVMSRRAAIQNRTTPDEVVVDDDDENQDPIHHIWYINTIGLEESVINSITACKYKRGEGLIDETDCSVCLGEFSDGDDVRLLPKCSHAFHVPCIDTWLRSHVNCPLCRAAVVCSTMNSSPANPNPESLDVVDETQMGNPGTDTMLGRNQSCRVDSNPREEEAEVEAGDQLGDIETGKQMFSSVVNCGFRVQSDLSDNRRLDGCATEMNDNEMVPVRRSVSMDSLSASLIRVALTDHFLIDSEGSSSAIATQSPMNKKSNPGELSRMKKTTPNQNQSMLKMVSIYSKGAFLQRPVAMKRSFSVGCKFLLGRNSRSRKMVLPL